jgi:hypothetical protein
MEEFWKDKSILIGCNASQPSVHEMPDCFHAPKHSNQRPLMAALKGIEPFYIFSSKSGQELF